MNRVIHIFGASGAGTSTLGSYICDRLGYFFLDTDNYFWEPTDPPYSKKREKSERIRLMRQDIEEHENVVISGSLVDWGDELIPLFTHAIRIETDTKVRMERLKSREHGHFGARIEEGGDMYEAHLAFLEWAAAYDTGGLDMRSKAEHDQWQKLLHCKRIDLDGTVAPERNFETIQEWL